MPQEHAHGIEVTAHRRTVERGDTILIARTRIETAREHRFERRSVTRFGGAMQHLMVLRSQLSSQLRMSGEHRVGVRAITAGACRNKVIQGRQLITRSVRQQPVGDLLVAVSAGQGVWRGAIGPAPGYVGPTGDQPFDHGDVPSAGGHMQRRFIEIAPREIRIGTMVEQPELTITDFASRYLLTWLSVLWRVRIGSWAGGRSSGPAARGRYHT